MGTKNANEWVISGYDLKNPSAQGETLASSPGISANWQCKDYDKLYLWVVVASAYPSYSSRSPKLNMKFYLDDKNIFSWKPDGYTDYLKVTALPVLTFGNAPYTTKSWFFDLSTYNIGNLTCKYWLSSGAAFVTTTRATYGITAVFK